METVKALVALFLPKYSPIKVGVLPLGWVIAGVALAVAKIAG